MLERDFEDFKNHHKNPINAWFHVACAIGFVSLLFSTLGPVSAVVAVFLYGIFLFSTLPKSIKWSGLASTVVVLVLQPMLVRIPMKTALALAIVFYMLPEVSHRVVNEKTVISFDTFTLRDALVNVLYLLPFSIATAFNVPFEKHDDKEYA